MAVANTLAPPKIEVGALLVVLLAVVPIVLRLLKALEKLKLLPGALT